MLLEVASPLRRWPLRDISVTYARPDARDAPCVAAILAWASGPRKYRTQARDGGEMAASGRGPQQDIGALAGPAVPASALRWRRVFPCDEQQLAVLRRWLESLLPECPARDDVTYVATELGTNAVQHTASGRDGWFAVEITWHRAMVRVAVADGGAPAGPRVIDDPDGEHGRGLLVVAGLSARTGVCGDDRGHLVWADIPWGHTAATGPASPWSRMRPRSVTHRPAASPGSRPASAGPPCVGGHWQAGNW
jgi:anti-sigma regulatory factor (Ser/Thr protein kinase)